MRKANLPNLDKIGVCKEIVIIDENKISDGEYFTMVQLKLDFDIFAIEFQKEEFTDVSWVIKSTMKKVNNFCKK